MMQILEQSQHVLILRNRPIRNWVLAALFLPILLTWAGLIIHAFAVSAVKDGLNFQSVLILCVLAVGWLYLLLDMWIHARITHCIFDKASGSATFTCYGIRPQITQFPLNDITAVDIEIVEGVSRGGTVIRRHRPYLRLRSNHKIPLSANYIGLQASAEIVSLIQDFLK